MASLVPLNGYWLWFAWGLIAIVVVIGYFEVRRRLARAERKEDAADAALRARHYAEHEKHKHNKGVE